MTAVFRSHDVPMCPQRIDPDEWQLCGGTALGTAEEWSNRACGMAALKMVLASFDISTPSLAKLVKEGVAQGSYTQRGWLHLGLAEMAHNFGVSAQAEAVAASELPGRLDKAPLIASVTREFPLDGRRGGHLVVLRGYEIGNDDPILLFRDPSRWGQNHDRIQLSQLSQSYAGRCITFEPV